MHYDPDHVRTQRAHYRMSYSSVSSMRSVKRRDNRNNIRTQHHRMWGEHHLRKLRRAGPISIGETMLRLEMQFFPKKIVQASRPMRCHWISFHPYVSSFALTEKNEQRHWIGFPQPKLIWRTRHTHRRAATAASSIVSAFSLIAIVIRWWQCELQWTRHQQIA